jgi:hypothetical protein
MPRWPTVDPVMRGIITGKDVVLHSASIVRHFGVAAYLACVWATLTRKQTTFLRVLYPAREVEHPRPRADESRWGAGHEAALGTSRPAA